MVGPITKGPGERGHNFRRKRRRKTTNTRKRPPTRPLIFSTDYKMEMRLVTINIRGVRDKDADIRGLARQHRADFVLLVQETYIDTEPKFKDLLERLGISEGH